MHPLGRTDYLLGTDLDEVLEGFAVGPEVGAASANDEATAGARIGMALDIGRDPNLLSDAFKRTIENSRDGKLRARTRYRGQDRRGVQTFAQLDERDFNEAQQCIGDGMRGLAYYRSAKVQALPKAQREGIRAEALGRLRQGRRWLDEIVEGNTTKAKAK
jgi:hypothetical protein